MTQIEQAFERAARVCEERIEELGNTRSVEDMIVKAEMAEMASRIRALSPGLTKALAEKAAELIAMVEERK